MSGRARSIWSAGALLVLLAALAVGPGLAQPARAATPNADAAGRALAWLRTQQLPDGSFAGFSGTSDPGSTADAVLAFAAAGVDPSGVTSTGGSDPIAYLKSVPDLVGNPGLAGKVVLAFTAANAGPDDASGLDLTVAINQGYNADTGWYGQSFAGHLYAVLALEARGLPVEQGAMAAIFNAQQPDGSWNFNGDPTPGTGDSNTTALAVQALAASGSGRDAAVRGIAYIESLQDANGAVGYDANSVAAGGGDANSTAFAIQAELAVGGNPATAPGGDMTAALLTFQNPSGAFQFQPAYPDDSLLATIQAVPALEQKPLPLGPINPASALLAAVMPAAPQPDCDFQDVTQHNLCGAFRDYWNANGGLANFGYVLSEAFEESIVEPGNSFASSYLTQYFERAVFEYHPENAGTPYVVLLRRVGAAVADAQYASQEAPATAQDGCQFFDVTAHNVCGNMAQAWNDFGGLAVFGYPLTEPFVEDGVTVQYFERARFEYAPGAWPARDDVLLGRLGADALDRALAQ